MTSQAKNFCKYVGLNVIATIGLSIYILADTVFIANATGPNGLIALNFSLSVFCVMSGLGIMTGIGGATRFAILKAEGNTEKCNSAFTHSVLLGGIIAALFLILAIFFITPLSKLLGADEVTLPYTVIYLRTLLLFSPFFVLNNILIAFVRNDNNPKLAMISTLVSSFFNIIFDYILMYPLSMGIYGAALATACSPVVGIIILSFHFIKKKNTFKLAKVKISIKTFFKIIPLGFSSLISELASSVSIFTFNRSILSIAGNTGVAAYGIIANTALIVVSIFTGVSQGIQPLASKSYGENDSKSVHKILKYTIITALSLAAIIYVLIFFFTDGIITVFNSTDDNSIRSIAETGLRIYFVAFFFSGLNIVISSFLSAIAKPTQAMSIALLRGCIILIPAILLLGKLFDLNGIWASYAVTEFIVAVLSIIFLVKLRKNKNSLYD